MAYLLILPIGLYTILAVLVLQRQPRGISNYVLATYLISAAMVTSGFMILGTTSDSQIAQIITVIIVLISSWMYLAFLPITLAGLYFESWLHIHQRRLLSLSLASIIIIDAILLWGMLEHASILVVPLETGFWVRWALEKTAFSPTLSVILVIACQITTVLVLGIALHFRRLTLWKDAVPFLLASTLSILIPLLSPLAQEDFCITVAALGYLPPVLVLTLLVFRSSQHIPLEMLAQSTLAGYGEGIIVIDSQKRLVWKNPQISQWLSPTPLGAFAPTHIFELLRGTPLQGTVRHLLDTGQTTDECEITLNGEEYVIRVDLRPLEPRWAPPGAQLLLFRDITASRIRRDLNERRQELLALSAISADISSSLEVDQVITRALRQVLEITGLDSAIVYLVDPGTPMVLKQAGRLDLHPTSAIPPDTIPVENSTAGWVIQHQQPVIINDAQQSQEHGSPLITAGMEAGATLPLIAHDRAIGVLQAASQTPYEFDAVEVALLESVGRQLAIAIDNARLHTEERQQRRVSEALREVANVLGSKKLDEALGAILEQLADILEYDRAAVLLLDEPGYLSVRAHAGSEFASDDVGLSPRRVEIARYPYLLHLFTQHIPQLVANTVEDAEWVPDKKPSGSWIGAPLIIREQVLGCLSITHRQPGRFTHADLQLANTFAGQAAIAVENAQLFEAEQRRRTQAELLQRASYDVVASPDLDSALSAALKSLIQVVPFDRAQIGLVDDTNRTWTPRAFYPFATLSPNNAPIPVDAYPLIQRVIVEKRAVLVPDTRQNRWWQPAQFDTPEVRCWIGVPLIVRDQVIGILNMDNFRVRGFAQEELQIAQLFANQVAAVIENFRLLEEASQQNRALTALNTVLAASNEALVQENLAGVLLERVLETLNLSGGAIHHYDLSTKELILQAASGIPQEVSEALECIPAATSLPTITLPSGESYEFFSIPLTSHGAEIGLLSVRRSDNILFSVELQKLLVNIGQQLGVVMDNAMLFENTMRREAFSTDLGRLGLAISAQLDRDMVLKMVCRESIAVFNAHGAYIWLIEQDQLVGAAAHGPGAKQFLGDTIELTETKLLPVRVIHDWHSRHINRVAAQTDALPARFLELTHAQAVIAVPLVKAHVPIGTLLLINTENPNAFADWLTEQTGLLGVQAALAIQNVTLFDEIRRRLDQLRLVNEVGRYATAILNLQGLIEGVAKKLFDILQYDIISLLEVQNGRLFLHSMVVRDRSLPEDHIPQRYLPLEGVVGQAVQHAGPVIDNQLRNLGELTGENDEQVEYCSLAMPLIIADEVIGALVVERRGFSSITQEDLDVMEPLAAQLAISVSNARLFEKVRQQTVELEARVAERTAQIRQQQDRTEAILRSVADAVIVFDLAGQLVMTNPAAKELFDRHDLEMDLGTRIGDLVARTMASETETGDSTEIIGLGAVALQAKAARVVEGDQILGSVVILRDISRLQELDRMKDRFVSNVSHELRTPLANLKLYLSLLQQGRPERRENYIDVMEREVERLARLVGDMLDLSRLQSQQRAERPQVRRPVDVEPLIEAVIYNNIARAESQREELRYENPSAPLPQILGDPDQIVRAITNLVSNAINYTPEGGHIGVRSLVSRTEQPEAEWVIIEVTDTGIGIPADEIPKIFDRFYRGSNVNLNIPGTGLGLAIIKEIVELHGGSIQVESEKGRGSTFRLMFPALSVGQSYAVGEKPDEEINYPGGGR